MVDAAAPGWRARLRRSRVGSWLLKAVVFALGAVFIGLGLLLLVLPGPLTIPPVLLGLYIWSTEFAWAERLRARAATRARVALQAARRRPGHTAAATLSGLVLLAAAVLAAGRFRIVDRVLGAFG